MHSNQPFYVIGTGPHSLSGLHSLAGTGSWTDPNGRVITENVAIVPVHGSILAEAAQEAAQATGETCVLAVDSAGLGFLVYQDGTEESVGRWGEVPDGYTGDHTRINGKVYACR